MKHFLTTVLVALSLHTIAKQGDSLFVPQIEGTIRGKYEYANNIDEHRFQVRNARFSVNGKFSPISSYKAEIDLSDEGVTKMLDAYVRLQPQSWWHFTIGQQKVPFSTDNLRSPHQLYFANRSFIGKQLTGLRDVGATFEIINKKTVPFNTMLGIYNGTGLYNQKTWRKSDELSFAARISANPVSKLNISLNMNSIKPTNLRMNLYNAGFYYDFNGLHIESEYFYKTYHDNTFVDTKGFFTFISYGIKTPKCNNIKLISPRIRYDIMTQNQRFDDSGNLKTDFARSRVTGGVNISLAKPFLNHIHINYEKYFYENGITNNDDKIVLEFVVRF